MISRDDLHLMIEDIVDEKLRKMLANYSLIPKNPI